MSGALLLSTAYLPPLEYFSAMIAAEEIIIERMESYHKQTYRNRCYILSAHGLQILTVPVREGSFRTVPVRDLRIDYSKRWQQVHMRALDAAYRGSAFYDYYSDGFKSSVMKGHEFLLDLNNELLSYLADCLSINKKISFSDAFLPASDSPSDKRYLITPKKESPLLQLKYRQVFNSAGIYDSRLSIVDLLFNMGPDSPAFLEIRT
jgi:hypothetical protein